MRAGLQLGQDQGMPRPAADGGPVSAATPTTKEIPYDYVARFKLQGAAGNRVQDVINISTDGVFVAVAIAYSFIPAALEIRQPPPIILGADSVDGLIAQLTEKDQLTLSQSLFVRLCGINFKYSIVDSGSGRELQNQPIHNIAGLGEANGERPFRPLAKPMMFMPRSTIRIEIEEISVGSVYSGADLFFVLHGYKILGYGT